ncbi:Cdc6/Cdc18 family protein [Desulfurococcus mucosus]|uniref:ORC1-type DNA replication protein n=1 Tax=Desulfurococcus mucosus (strain ATCC 35584 / DSM 2162 / JCM 9187 / O7/1) TaxID=765177 RepID=E8RA43_DESM0|nr:orc1/cdc6 family replication initiation protein [Desulfurococcus mucosus]ADV64321.1 ORC complex protein Cdc6/Orc1 [Desulfurococcus mucosus DSM 2162]
MEDIIDELIKKRGFASKVFKNREVLHPDYIPDTLPHRENEIKKLAEHLLVSAQGIRPSNVLIYGLTGTGKTVVAKYVVGKLKEKASMLSTRLDYAYVNTRKLDTTYRVIASIAQSIGLRIPHTGLAVSEVYRRYINALESWGGLHIVVLDEVDYYVKREGDDLIYKLVRANEELTRAKIVLVGITNDINFVENLDPRVRSSMGEVEMVFPPYNAEQLYTILRQRAELAFNPGVIDDGVISYCAALAAREHGDARRALDLLRVSGEIADREGADRVTIEHVKKATLEIEEGRIYQSVVTLPLHQKIVLKKIVELVEAKGSATTGEIYAAYAESMKSLKYEPLSPRRISEILMQLDMMGLITSETISRGRYGVTKVVRVKKDVLQVVKEALKDVEA